MFKTNWQCCFSHSILCAAVIAIPGAMIDAPPMKDSWKAAVLEVPAVRPSTSTKFVLEIKTNHYGSSS